MAEVGYLIGAGASVGCVPAVASMGGSSTDIYREFSKIWSSSRESLEITSGTSINAHDLSTLCSTILRNISTYSANHSSIDTYAKKLFVSGKKLEYCRLKNELAFYFTLIQILYPPDKRYDNFWASILNKTMPPKKIKIFSWNYDFQFERSYMDFSGKKTLDQVWVDLSMCSPWCQMDKGMEDYFHITKLNGSARFRIEDSRDGASYYCNFDSSDKLTNIRNLFKSFYLSHLDNSEKIKCELEFAWETFPRNTLLDNIKPVLGKVEVLVIIGYSFPFFNRKVDQQLFDGMTSLQKIIIQDMDPEGIRERLIEFIGDEVHIELKRNVGQFVFPKELEV